MEISTLQATIVLSLVGLCISFYFSRHSKKIAHEKMMKELFKEFNERYDALNDHLLEIEQIYPTIEKFRQAENQDELKKRVIDYFNLCAEEYFWFHHKKRIDKLIWKPWHSGMNYWYKNVPIIKVLWTEEIKANGHLAYYITDKNGFFDE